MAQKKSKNTVAGSIKIDPLASVSEFKVHGDWGIFTLNADLLHLISGSFQNELLLPLEIPIVIVDARDSTVLDSDSLIIYQSMRLMYGMNSLQASQKLMRPLTCLALLQGDFKITPSPPTVKEFKFNTMTERLVISENWVSVELQSDLFVVPTSLGYSPALLVKCSDESHKHLLCGAKSIKEPLERLRTEHGGLIGLVISLRKMSDDKTAPYQVVPGKLNSK